MDGNYGELESRRGGDESWRGAEREDNVARLKPNVEKRRAECG